MTGQGELYVDPEGVSRIGQQYGDKAQLFRSYLSQLETLRSTYANSWGNDDLGQKFSQKFLQGLDALEGLVGSVADTLDYTAEGLDQTGKSFRAAHDDADEASSKLRTKFEDQPVDVAQHNVPHAEDGAGEQLRDQKLVRRLARKGEVLTGNEGESHPGRKMLERVVSPDDTLQHNEPLAGTAPTPNVPTDQSIARRGFIPALSPLIPDAGRVMTDGRWIPDLDAPHIIRLYTDPNDPNSVADVQVAEVGERWIGAGSTPLGIKAVPKN